MGRKDGRPPTLPPRLVKQEAANRQSRVRTLGEIMSEKKILADFDALVEKTVALTQQHRKRRRERQFVASTQSNGGLFPSEAEIARRLSQDPSTWKAKAIVLERHGFPRVNPLMGGRYWPAVLAWWNRQCGLFNVDLPQPDGEEDLNAL